MIERKMNIGLSIKSLEEELNLLNEFLKNFKEGELPETGTYVLRYGKIETEERNDPYYFHSEDFSSFRIYHIERTEENNTEIEQEKHFLTYGDHKWERTIQLSHFVIGRCGINPKEIISIKQEEPIKVDEYYYHTQREMTNRAKQKTK